MEHASLSQETKEKVLHGNALKLFGLRTRVLT
jgi:predicted TIM-barrel fold metal-dependent hydrolase